MRNLKSLAVVAVLFTLAACAPAAPPVVDTAADEATFKAGTAAWLTAYNAGDVESIIAMYTEDAVVMPPNAPATRGPVALRAYLTTETAAAKTAGVKLVDGESGAGVSGDLGWHTGSYTVVDAAGATVDSGSYMEVWRRADGKWQIFRDIWNSDRPVATPAAAPAAPVR